MILVDANILLYAKFARFSQHDAAREWLDETLEGSLRVGFAWPSLLAFVRLASNPRVLEKPSTVQSAWKQVEEWLECPSVWIPQPTERHRDVLGTLLTSQATRPDLVTDAHLAALAMEHGLILCSTDGDFARFPDLRWKNPLFPSSVSEPARAARRAGPRAR